MAEETTTPGVSAENAAENLNFIEQEIKKDLEAGKNGGPASTHAFRPSRTVIFT